MPTKVEISLSTEQYLKDLETVIGETRKAAAKMSNLEWVTDAPEKTIQVKPEVRDMEKLNDLRKAIEKLPAKKTVTIPVKTFGGELKKNWTELRQQLNDFSGGAKKLMSTVLGTGGGPIGIFAAALASLWKIAGMYLDRQTEKMKEASEQAERNASSIAEAAAVNEKYRQAGEGALRKLSELSNVEKLSNVQKAEAVSLIAKLTRQYGDLGISIDRSTGKITGLDRAMVTRLQKDKDRRIRELEGQLKELRSARNEQDKIIADAGYTAGWKDDDGRPVRWGGEQKAKEAQQKREGLDKQIRDLMIQLNEARKSDAAADYVNQQAAAVADIEAQTRAREKDLSRRQWQDKVNAVDDREEKIDLIDSRKIWAQEERKRHQAEYKQAKNDFLSARNEADQVEAERKMAVARAKVQKSDEEIYNLQQQINDLRRQENKEVDRILDQSAFELKYNQLIAAGEWDKAAALKQEYELKQRYLKLSDEEKKQLAEDRKRQRELNLRGSLRDQAQNLSWSAMEKAGLGQFAAEQRALHDAEKTKGGKLTDDETAAVRKLSELTWQMQNLPHLPMGDLSIRTNSLTARGGFQGGAAVPDKDQVNKAISASVRQTYERLGEIREFLDKINISVKDSGKIRL